MFAHTRGHKLACNSCPKIKLSHLKLLQVFSPKVEKLFTLNMKTCNKFNYTKLVTCSFPLEKIQKKKVQVTNIHQSQHNLDHPHNKTRCSLIFKPIIRDQKKVVFRSIQNKIHMCQKRKTQEKQKP